MDLCEIARNSVLQSSFPTAQKLDWLGLSDYRNMLIENNINYTNLPMIRFKFRQQTLSEELAIIQGKGQTCSISSNIVNLLLRPSMMMEEIHQAESIKDSEDQTERLDVTDIQPQTDEKKLQLPPGTFSLWKEEKWDDNAKTPKRNKTSENDWDDA